MSRQVVNAFWRSRNLTSIVLAIPEPPWKIT
jgi:hypothetical protein